MIGKLCGAFTGSWPNPTLHSHTSAVILKTEAYLLSKGSWFLVPEREQTLVSKNCVWSQKDQCKVFVFLKHTVKQTTNQLLPRTKYYRGQQQMYQKPGRKSWGDSFFMKLEQSKLISYTGEFRKPHEHTINNTCSGKI